MFGTLINEVEQAILNYCCIPEVPDALCYTWANMVFDLYQYQNAVNIGLAGDDDDMVTTILNGNFGTIDMGDSMWKQGEADMSSPYYRGISAHSGNLDDVLMNYRAQLNRFRLIW